MSLFQKATNRQAFLKMGMYGMEGAGKSYTASLIAIGLHQYIKSKKPIGFFDTETGSDYVLRLFGQAEIDLQVVKSRAIKTLKEAIQEACAMSDILIVDSLTHPYRELCSTYTKSKKSGGKFIDIRDWSIIKEVWADCFSTPYVNSSLHFIWCARAKNLFEDVEDVDASDAAGRKVFRPHQIGTAARAETESAYEPSILIEMTREMMGDGGKYLRRATVVKDRMNVIDGKQVDNPTFKDFLPHIALLNLGGEHLGVTSETSAALFAGDDKDLAMLRRRRTIAWEQIENGLSVSFPGGTGKDKQARFAILSELTGTTSETELQQRHPEALERIARTVTALGQALLDGESFATLMELKKLVRRLHDTAAPSAVATPEEFTDAMSREIDKTLL